MMKSVDLETLRRDWDGVATHLKSDYGGSVLLSGSEEFVPGGIFVYGTATAKLFQGLMKDRSVHSDVWCLSPRHLTSLEELAARIKAEHILVLGACQGEEVYLALLDKSAADGQDQWHATLVESLGEFMGRKRVQMVEVTQAEARALQQTYDYLRVCGSLDPAADFQAVMSHCTIANLAATELYRVLMEPVFHHQGEGAELAVTAFRSLRDLSAAEVYNWLHHFKCIDCDEPFLDVKYVLSELLHGYWHLHDSSLRGSRLFFLNRDELYQESMTTGEELALEYVIIPESLRYEDVERTGDKSTLVRTNDIVVTSGFPTDPVREYHKRI